MINIQSGQVEDIYCTVVRVSANIVCWPGLCSILYGGQTEAQYCIAVKLRPIFNFGQVQDQYCTVARVRINITLWPV